ncbi:hypothetical protein F5X99DRAFT_368053 [Biscogniauxia marginata]|nr:hypothetical protein F5X99DRAFT_368053 [Biscogniauxia marginata]
MPPRQSVLPLAYRFFFLIAEPLAALTCAYHAHFRQDAYLSSFASFSSSPSSSQEGGETIPPATSVALSQLASQYLLSALAEALVLRSTGDLAVWRTLLAALLAADLGRLYALSSLGLGQGAYDVYWDARAWDAVGWTCVPLVYLGIAARVAFLCGVGLGRSGGGGKVRKAV